MKLRNIQILDPFQIVGFVISVAISLGLIVLGKDTIQSVTLGLVLAILTQLFDLQLRHSSSEERLLTAGTLSRSLYQDTRLLTQIQEIINAYLHLKTHEFELFRRRSDDAIVECCNVLHGMTEGYLITPPQGPYSYSIKAFDSATNSIKAVAIADFSYWRSRYAYSYLQANKRAVDRGVEVTRVFVVDRTTLETITDILDIHCDIGVTVYTAVTDEVPSHLIEDNLIVDDRIFARSELSSDGIIREERVSIDTTEVEQAVNRFDQLLRYSEIMCSRSTSSDAIPSTPK